MNLTSIEIPYNGKRFFIDIAEGNMVSLNRIFEISGAEETQSPKRWTVLPSVKNLLETIGNQKDGKSVLLKKAGKNGGTWAHWQLALSYAQYLSPELHLAVNQAFKERLEENIDPELGISRSVERARKFWRSQGKSDQWIKEREQGKHIREVYVSTLINHDVKPGSEVGRCTNQIYKGLFFKDSTEIENDLRKNNQDLPLKINIRDYAKLSSLAAIGLAEALSSEKIDEINAQGVDHCAKVSHEKASSVRMALESDKSKEKAMQPPDQHKSSVDKEKNKAKIQSLRDALKGS